MREVILYCVCFTHRILFANHSQNQQFITSFYTLAPRLTTTRLELDADVGEAEQWTLLARASTSRSRRSRTAVSSTEESPIFHSALITFPGEIRRSVHMLTDVERAKELALAKERTFNPFSQAKFWEKLSLSPTSCTSSTLEPTCSTKRNQRAL